ncbi:type II toxin-antitoxin system VapC family toxin [Candidatus Curtissbacteria bacterium]|nr:type II toxin-antitoxin system VapC family toxin [Candidatus Curtissbacteria bacterium]
MIIVDASVANKLFLTHESGYKQVKTIFRKHVNDTEKILVPDLLFYEIANTLATKLMVPSVKIGLALNQLDKYDLEIFRSSLKDIFKIAVFAKEFHVSVYDATYAVLAKEKGCELITADEKFVKQVNLSFVKSLQDYSDV